MQYGLEIIFNNMCCGLKLCLLVKSTGSLNLLLARNHARIFQGRGGEEVSCHLLCVVCIKKAYKKGHGHRHPGLSVGF